MSAIRNQLSISKRILTALGNSSIPVVSITAIFLWKGDIDNVTYLEIAKILVTTATLWVPAQEIAKNLLNRFMQRIEMRLAEKIDLFADFCIDGFGYFVQFLLYRDPIRFKSRYCKYVKDIYCDFEMPGSRRMFALECELEEMYISFNFVYDEHEKTPIASNDEYGLSAIWNALVRREGGRRYHPIMITGSPGSGKTTLLKYLLLSCAGVKRTKASRKFRRLTPIFLPLREITSGILANPSLDLASVIESQKSIQDLKPSHGWFQIQLKRRRCLVMLDGIDEIANEDDQIQVGKWIDRQIRRYPDTAFIITSRPFLYRKELIKGVKTFLEIREMNFKQAEKFIVSWYLQHEVQRNYIVKNKKGKKTLLLRAQKRSNKLIVRIKNNAYLFKLTGTPLLLNMIIAVHENGHELPKSRVALYEEICRAMLKRREASSEEKELASNQKIDLTPAQKLSLLRRLALLLCLKQKLVFSPEEKHVQRLIRKTLDEFPGGDKVSVDAFLKHIVYDVGLLAVGENAGHYEFNHRCIQEYLAASIIKDRRMENLLIDRILHQWWEETIRLYAAQSNATRIITQAHELAESDKNNVFAFKLVYDCLAEAMEVDLTLRTRLENSLDQCLDSLEPAERSKAAEVKLIQRFDRLIPISGSSEIDRNYITCCEYQLFIDECLQSQEEYRQPDSWSAPSFSGGMARQSITGMRPRDVKAFCEWLTQKYGLNGNFQFRPPTYEEESTFLQEGLINQQHHGGWCIKGNDLSIEYLDSQLCATWRENLNKKLSHHISQVKQLKKKLLLGANICSQCQSLNEREFFPALEALVNYDIRPDAFKTFGLDVSNVNTLLLSLKSVFVIYQRIQKARSQGRGYEISRERALIVNMARQFENDAILKYSKLASSLLKFERALGIHGNPIRQISFKVAQDILALLQKFMTLADYQVSARIRDLYSTQSYLDPFLLQEFYDVELCINVGSIVSNDLKSFNLNQGNRVEQLVQLDKEEVGLACLIREMNVSIIEEDFECNFLRQSPSYRNFSNIRSHLLMAASLWSSLTYVYRLGKVPHLTKRPDQHGIMRVSSNAYINRRSQALKAYLLTIILEQQIRGTLPSLGGIRLVRERILD